MQVERLHQKIYREKKKFLCKWKTFFYSHTTEFKKIRGLNKIKKISNIKKLLFYYKIGEKSTSY